MVTLEKERGICVHCLVGWLAEEKMKTTRIGIWSSINLSFEHYVAIARYIYMYGRFPEVSTAILMVLPPHLRPSYSHIHRTVAQLALLVGCRSRHINTAQTNTQTRYNGPLIDMLLLPKLHHNTPYDRGPHASNPIIYIHLLEK